MRGAGCGVIRCGAMMQCNVRCESTVARTVRPREDVHSPVGISHHTYHSYLVIGSGQRTHAPEVAQQQPGLLLLHGEETR